MATTTTKTVMVCDSCQRETNLTPDKCIVCGAEICWLCKDLVVGCIVEAKVCRKCGDKPKVAEIYKTFAQGLRDVLNRRNEAFKALKGK